ncbi:MAG: 50S ribosomal protein L24 [Candidatus Hydrogenedentes bacterium]|nr:50S ribosomal protein L24 [Candidatus Hydrogenedentota bacterium]
MHIRKGDTVVVITGKYKGRRGRVLRVMPKNGTLLVEGVRMMKRHTKPSNRNQQGGIVEREAPVNLSNVMPWCDSAGKPSKILMKRLEDGTRVRVFKINGETLND